MRFLLRMAVGGATCIVILVAAKEVSALLLTDLFQTFVFLSLAYIVGAEVTTET